MLANTMGTVTNTLIVITPVFTVAEIALTLFGIPSGVPRLNTPFIIAGRMRY